MSHNTTGRLAEPQPDGFGKAIAQLAVSHSSRALMHVLVLTNAAKCYRAPAGKLICTTHYSQDVSAQAQPMDTLPQDSSLEAFKSQSH